MPNLQHLPPELRIKRYRAEVEFHQGRSGKASKVMLRVYKQLLEAAEEELAGIPPNNNNTS